MSLASKIRGKMMVKVKSEAEQRAEVDAARAEAAALATSREAMLKRRIEHIKEIRRQPSYGKADRGWIRTILADIYDLELAG